MTMNGPSESSMKTVVNATQRPGAQRRTATVAAAIVSMTIHGIDTTFSTNPFGRLRSQAALQDPSQELNGFGIT